MSVKERLKEFIKYKNISERAFCIRIGVSTSYVNSIRKSIQPDKMKSIAAEFPELNPMWLITGEEQMLKNNQQIGNIKDSTVVGANVCGKNHSFNQGISEETIRQNSQNYQNMIKKQQDQIDELILIIKNLTDKK